MEAIKHITFGGAFVAVGVWLLISTHRDLRNLKEDTPLRPDYWGGYIAGVAFILGGILEMFGYWKW